MTRPKDPRTIAAGNGIASDTAFGAVTPPVYLSSTFAFAGFERSRTHDYSRTANPSRDLLADTVAKLEGGAGAVVVSSGMAAVDLVLSLLGPDELVVRRMTVTAGHIVCCRSAVSASNFMTASALSTRAMRRRCPTPWAIGLPSFGSKTPSNPLMRVVDIRAIAARAKGAGAKVAVDNTFLSPALQRPILMAPTLRFRSTTRYLNGHSDVVGGAVVAAEKTDAEKLAALANITGVTGSPFDSNLHPARPAHAVSAHRAPAGDGHGGGRIPVRSSGCSAPGITRACRRIPDMRWRLRSNPASEPCSASNLQAES